MEGRGSLEPEALISIGALLSVVCCKVEVESPGSGEVVDSTSVSVPGGD